MVFYRHTQFQKIILRGIAFVWLFLIVAEIGCPVLCDENRRVQSDISSLADLRNSGSSHTETILTPTNEEDCSKDKSACSCECLCHSPLLQIGVSHRAEIAVYSSKISLTLSAILSPPVDGFYRPPRFA